MSDTRKDMLPIFTVDAFTDEPFRGNPAAVCLIPYQKIVPESTKQKIATEMNLSETAFISIRDEKETFQNGKRYTLQWFTPKCEVVLCGHATLASASVLFSACCNDSPILEFETLSGVLKAKRLPDGKIELDLPAYDSKPVDVKKNERVIKAAVGSLAVQDAVLSDSGKLLIRLHDDITRSQLENLKPSYSEFLSVAPDLYGVIVTLNTSCSEDSTGKAYDFVSRYFAPWVGINEDPVTGAAHSVLAPYWSKVLKKSELYARQCSARGGDLKLNVKGDRVAVAGHSVLMVQGQINF